MGKVYGIDLGTTYSVIATLDDNGMPTVIENQPDASPLLASAVYFQEGGDPVVGEYAKEMKESEPDRVVEFVKRYIGRSDAPTYEFDGVQYDPITISALILKRIKSYADEQGNNVQDVVITCPAYFGNNERTATKQAGELAGLNVLNIVNEPTAAALNYCVREFKESRKILVYDLGGGTFDITLLDFSVDDGGAHVNVIDTGGNQRLGGVDWDGRLFDLLCKKYGEENNVKVADMDTELKAQIRAKVEEVKRGLSRVQNRSVIINYEGEQTKISVSCQEFEESTRDLVDQTTALVQKLLGDNNLTPEDIDVVLLVGGSTQMPMVKDAVKNLFSEDKVRVEEPNLAVAKGAALAAAIAWNEHIKKHDKPTPVGPDNQNNDGGGTGDDPGTIEAGGKGPIGFDDIIPRSLGPCVYLPDDGEYVIQNLLFVNTKIPAEKEEVYGTHSVTSEVVVHIYENVSKEEYVRGCFDEHGNFLDNRPELDIKSLGEARLKLPENMPQGSPIRVVFHSDTQGLTVTVIDETTGQSNEIAIEAKAIIPPDKLQEIKKRISQTNTLPQI